MSENKAKFLTVMERKTLKEKILSLAAKRPEGFLLSTQSLLGLGSRPAIDQTLSRLAKEGALMRVERGLYVSPLKTRFGNRAPEAGKVIAALSAQCGETVVPNEAAAANALGLTTQVPVREVYLTSGRSRRLTLGSQHVELKHAPAWKLALGNRPSGQALRALSWAGERHSQEVASKLKAHLPKEEIAELTSARIPYMPAWMSEQIKALQQDG